jgi:hypothetical protein
MRTPHFHGTLDITRLRAVDADDHCRPPRQLVLAAVYDHFAVDRASTIWRHAEPFHAVGPMIGSGGEPVQSAMARPSSK